MMRLTRTAISALDVLSERDAWSSNDVPVHKESNHEQPEGGQERGGAFGHKLQID